MVVNIPEEKRKLIAEALRKGADAAEQGDVTTLMKEILAALGIVASEADAYSKRLGFDVKGLVRGYVQRGVNQIFGADGAAR